MAQLWLLGKIDNLTSGLQVFKEVMINFAAEIVNTILCVNFLSQKMAYIIAMNLCDSKNSIQFDKNRINNEKHKPGKTNHIKEKYIYLSGCKLHK